MQLLFYECLNDNFYVFYIDYYMPLFSYTVFSQHKHAREQRDTDYIAKCMCIKGMSYALLMMLFYYGFCITIKFVKSLQAVG